MGTVSIWNKGRESEALHDSTGERLAEGSLKVVERAGGDVETAGVLEGLNPANRGRTSVRAMFFGAHDG